MKSIRKAIKNEFFSCDSFKKMPGERKTRPPEERFSEIMNNYPSETDFQKPHCQKLLTDSSARLPPASPTKTASEE